MNNGSHDRNGDSDQQPRPGALLDDMITHNDLLERYPWLSAQIINGWIRRGLIRTFRGNRGMTVYSRMELDHALNEDLRGVPEAESPATATARTSSRDEAEAAIISERLWRRSIKGKKGLSTEEEEDFERRLKEVRGETPE